MTLKDFKIIKRLGEGAYSSVYSVVRHSDGVQYALKKVKMGKLSDKEKENALNEVRILASIQHKNICSYHEAFMDEGSSSLCIIMEYADNGDLFQKITRHQKEQTYLREDDIWRIFIQVVKGLKALHETNIFHRDLKSANVFLNKDGATKLGDMNVSKVAKRGLLYTQTGTPYYASPEVWRDQPYDMKSDIWSLGCVLYESITLRPPFRADDMAGLYRKVLRGAYSRIPEHFSSDLNEVCKSLIQVQAQQRPTCQQILSMPAVIRMGEQLFMDDFYDDDVGYSGGQNELLSTIRVPKNLLYLTDRLPKPSYEQDTATRLQNRSVDDDHKRRTVPAQQQHDNSSAGDPQSSPKGRLPSIPRQSSNSKTKNQRSKSKHGGGASSNRSPGAESSEVTQSQALPNLEKQRASHQPAQRQSPQNNAPTANTSLKQRNLKKSNPPQPSASTKLAPGAAASDTGHQQQDKTRSLDHNQATVETNSVPGGGAGGGQPTLQESPSLKTLDSQRQQQQNRQVQQRKPAANQLTSKNSQQALKEFENQPLSIQGEGSKRKTTKQHQQQQQQQLNQQQTRANTQLHQISSSTPTSVNTAVVSRHQQRLRAVGAGHNTRGSQPVVKAPGGGGDDEYEADEFEKDDLVQMAEPPNKPIIRKQNGEKGGIAATTTNDSTTQSRAGHSDTNSLMREISIRNDASASIATNQMSKQTSQLTNEQQNNIAQSQNAYAPLGGVPQLKPVNRQLKGSHSLQRQVSDRSLVGSISARDSAAAAQHNQPNKDVLQPIQQSGGNLHTQRAQNPIYKSHGHPLQQQQPGQYDHHQASQNRVHPHQLQRKPRVNYPGNMAYINISSDGQRLVGPLGLKKAEQELIKRRYKYSYNNQDSISRVALVYGQPHASGSVGSRNAASGNQMMGPDSMHGAAGDQQQQMNNMYSYGPGSHRTNGSGSVSGTGATLLSPYLQQQQPYARGDIQSLYRRQQKNNDNLALPKLPRIANNSQRDGGGHGGGGNQGKGLPPINHTGGQPQMGSGRNQIQTQQLYGGSGGHGGGGASQAIYRNSGAKGSGGMNPRQSRAANIAREPPLAGENQSHNNPGSGPYSLDRQATDGQASIQGGLQVQTQPMMRGVGDRNGASNLQKKPVPPLPKQRLEPLNLSSSAVPIVDDSNTGSQRRGISPPPNQKLPKTTASKTPAVQMLSSND